MSDEPDDKLLAAYDLSAWEVPLPPLNLVDRVVERARLPVVAPRSRRRIAVIATSALVAVAAVATLVMVGSERAPVEANGEVVATAAQRLTVGTTSAMLDKDSRVRWHRQGSRIDVVQTGVATWTVGAHDTLRIDAGATVASVEAAGASLRVEVLMNRADVRMMGVSGATALAVALVTVTVYEGHVRATSADQRITILPGTTVELGKPAPPPAPPAPPAPRLESTVGAAPVSPPPPACDATRLELKGQRALRAKRYADAFAAFDAAYACAPSVEGARLAYLASCRLPDPPSRKYLQLATGDEVDEILFPLEKDCARLRKGASPPTCDAAAAERRGDDYLADGLDASALAQYERAYSCLPAPAVARKAFMSACKAKDGAAAKRWWTSLARETGADQLKQICIRTGVPLD